MRTFLGTLLLILATLVSPVQAQTLSGVQYYRIFGIITSDTLLEVQDLVKRINQDSEIKVLKIDITSPGGEAIAGFTISRMLRTLSNQGKVVVEIHASGLCASACTWILASGTPGHRYIETYTFTLVHPVQTMTIMGPVCIKYISNPSNVDELVDNLFLTIARDLYMEFTGQPKAVVTEWVTCGHEKAGMGQMLVDMKIADKLEPL